ncbi:MAG: DUF3857 and transglutaminase domain-containing protein [Phycisphaerales bacterium]|nr:MAG: DUF3857 and transglutaminase domain-containing protein [Phycisphaerales bacterium]
MKKTHLWMVALLAISGSALAQEAEDVLYLQDGRERVGRLVEISKEAVLFEVKGEIGAQSFALSDVQRIDLAGVRVGDEVGRVEDLDDPLLRRVLKASPTTFLLLDSGYVTMYDLLEKRLHRDGSYTHRERVVQKVLLERGKNRANVARYFRKGDETLEVDFARTINPDGTVIPITEAAIDITSVNADTPEYEKQQQLKFTMKQVAENSILDYQITRRQLQTTLLDPLFAWAYFQETEPVFEREMRIIIPQDRKLSVAKQRADRVTATTEESGDEIVYSFSIKNSPRIVPEPNMPPRADCLPRVVVAEQTTWDKIGEAYRLALLDASTTSPAITEKVGELVAGAANPEEKARRIYRYFTNEIRQLWVRPSAYSYAPRPVDAVFEKLAGNTTDKAALLRAMLLEAGVEAHVVLCCPQGSGKLVENVPCIRQFNDALVAVDLPTGRTFLALDNDTARFGQVPSEYQGTRAMLVSKTDSQLIEVPLNEADEEMVASSYQMSVTPAGDLTVTATATPTGNYEMGYRAAWKDLKDDELRQQFEVALTDLHATARLHNYTIENLHDLDSQLTFSQTYTLEGYALGDDELLVFRLPEIDYSAGSVGKPQRVFPLRWDQRSKSTIDLTLSIPDGFRVYYAGKDYQAESEPTTFFARFDVDARQIRYRDEYVQREVEAPVEAYKDYKSCVETMARVPKEWIVLERINVEDSKLRP